MAMTMPRTTLDKLPVPTPILDSIYSIISSDYRKGTTINLKIPISIEDLYNGTTVKALF